MSEFIEGVLNIIKSAFIVIFFQIAKLFRRSGDSNKHTHH